MLSKGYKGKSNSLRIIISPVQTQPVDKACWLPWLPAFSGGSRAELSVVERVLLRCCFLGPKLCRCHGTRFTRRKLNQSTHWEPSANATSSRLGAMKEPAKAVHPATESQTIVQCDCLCARGLTSHKCQDLDSSSCI